MALPCTDQDKRWTPQQQLRYRQMLKEADEITCLSGHYTEGCMKQRNRYMVDRSGFCICALLHSGSGTSQTVRYATRQGLQVINLLP